MPEAKPAARLCPYCKEEIHPEALRCKHCLAAIPAAARPEHGGVCPRCKERIHPEALRCKHCKTTFGDNAGTPGFKRFDCNDCPPGWMEGSTLIGLIGCDEDWCYYDEVGIV